MIDTAPSTTARMRNPIGNPSLKIIFIVTRADTMAGAQTHVVEMAGALLEEGHQAHVLCGRGERLPDVLSSRGIPFTRVGALKRSLHPLHDLHALLSLTLHLRKAAPDLVSLHSSKAGILGRLACRMLGIPALFTAHGWAFAEGVGTRSRHVYALIERRLQRSSAQIICVSEADRRLAIKEGFDGTNMVTVHNGRHDRGEPRSSGRDAGGPMRLVMVGRLDRQKDHPTLFRALSFLDGWVLSLVGEGPDRVALQALTHECGIADRVDFVGETDDVAGVLASSDAFALISNWEGFPRSTLEAMRASLPVIVSDVGGSREAVKEGVTGLVVARGDIDGVRGAISGLIDDPEGARLMGKRGRTLFEERFTFDTMYRRTRTVQRTVLAASGPGSSVIRS